MPVELPHLVTATVPSQNFHLTSETHTRRLKYILTTDTHIYG